METGRSCDRNALLTRELLQGMELANQLRMELHSSSSVGRRESLAARILSSFENSLLILKWRDHPDHVSRTHSGVWDLEAPPSKKSKVVPALTGKVRVSSEMGLEGPQEDGFSWRKYGQKDILGAKYPRSYYRCSFRNTQNCMAVKQVQRSDEDPSVFEITYRGNHACSHGTLSVPEEDEEDKRNIHNEESKDQMTRENIHNRPVQSHGHVNLWITDTDASVRKEKTTSIGCMESKIQHFPRSTNHPLLGSFSQSVLSPATPESNSYFPSPGQSSNFGGIHNMVYSESELGEIFSARTCATNSQFASLNFSVDSGQSDPSFAFDTLRFFS